MSLERYLQIGMAAFTAVGTLLLGMAQQSWALPLAALAISAASVYLADVKRWIHLNPLVANIAALAALVASFWHLQALQGEGALLAMANMLAYLQFVLLFRRKNMRSYWLLALASLLQVSVAAALSLEPIFGILLTIYLFLGLATMTFFFLVREENCFRADPTANLLDELPSRGSRWPLANERSRAIAAPSEQASSGISRELFYRLGRLGFATLALTVVIFLAMPRFARTMNPLRTRSSDQMVGFSSQVTLGSLGQIIENPAQVMELKLTDWKTREPIVLAEAPLVRGTTLTSYRQGQWRRDMTRRERGKLTDVDDLPYLDGLVRQEFTLEPLDTEVIFGIWPLVTAPAQRGIGYDSFHGELYRYRLSLKENFKYQLLTTGIIDGRQIAITPAERWMEEAEIEGLRALPKPKDDVDPLSALKTRAADVVADIPASDPMARAQALLAHLRDSGLYRATLEQPARDGTLDPVEDFITRHPEGHCEYFASALALMLRSVGVPARMVIGFKASEFNDATQAYEIQQLHAHAWVEAFLTSEHVPAETGGAPYDDALAHSRGAWLRLDPTPAAIGPDPAADGYIVYLYRRMSDLAQAFWTKYVVGMDVQRQQQAIYRPITTALAEGVREALNTERWMGAIGRAWGWLVAIVSGVEIETSMSWVDLVFIALWAVAMTGVVYGAFRGLRVWRGWRPVSSENGTALPSEIEFYRRLEELLARHDLLRTPGQTQREFAHLAGGQLAESPVTQRVALVPRQIVEAFYRVRFGRRPLDNHEAQAVEQALAELAGALDGARASGPYLTQFL
jgi:transglutaminase-like putative cysteine protease